MSKALRSEEILALRKPPIAIGFFESPPAGVPRWKGRSVAAGCVFWDKAMNGQTFYNTVPSDHYNCAVGSYTHKIALPVERAHELNDTIAFQSYGIKASLCPTWFRSNLQQFMDSTAGVPGHGQRRNAEVDRKSLGRRSHEARRRDRFENRSNTELDRADRVAPQPQQ